MTDLEKREQIERKVHEYFYPNDRPNEVQKHDVFYHHIHCGKVADYILQRETALHDKLEIAENGIVSLHDALEENEQLRKVAEAASPLRDFVNDIYSPIKDSPALRQHLCNVAHALNAWKPGRTP